jgi:hypothetical protein
MLCGRASRVRFNCKIWGLQSTCKKGGRGIGIILSTRLMSITYVSISNTRQIRCRYCITVRILILLLISSDRTHPIAGMRFGFIPMDGLYILNVTSCYDLKRIIENQNHAVFCLLHKL